MDKASRVESVDLMYFAIGSALSSWTRVEIQLYQLFGVANVLTIMQAGGGFSSDMRVPYAVLDAIEGFSAKIKMIDRALNSAIGQLDVEAQDILSDWGKASEKIRSLHRNRNCLAHWTVARGFSKGAKVRLVPPSYSNNEHQGHSIRDIRNWEPAFIAAADRLESLVSRLASHQGLHHRHVMQVVEQVRIALPEQSPLMELLRGELQ